MLPSNNLSDISPLKELYGLEELDLSHNRIRDLSALEGHAALRRLDLNHNDITDIYALAGCTDLEELDLSYNRIGYLSHLNSCTSLRLLDLTGNSDLEADQIRTLQEALPECEIITDVDLSMPEPTPEPPEDAEIAGYPEGEDDTD
jgi:Leucine-rich repeat (LRR) protein